MVSLLECLDDPYRSLAGLCRLQSDLCEKLLPLVAHEMLVRGSDSVRRSLSEQVGTFFERVFNRDAVQSCREVHGNVVRNLGDLIAFAVLKNIPCICKRRTVLFCKVAIFEVN